MIFTALSFFLASSVGQAANPNAYDCKVVKLHYIRAKKSIKKNEAICVHKKNFALVSPMCLIRQCDIFKKIKESGDRPGLTSLGTPDHRLCHDIGGVPQVIDYKWGSQSVERSRCLSKVDGSFIDTETLVALKI